MQDPAMNKTVKKKAFPPTAEQQAVIDAIVNGESILAKAPAGSGKTEMFLRAILKIVEREGKPVALPSNRLLVVAFNVKVAHEIRNRLDKALGKPAEEYGITVKTLNGLGHGTLLANKYGKGNLEIDLRKTKNIVAELCSTENGRRAFLECCSTAAKKQGPSGMALAQSQMAAVMDLAKVYGITPGRLLANPEVASKLVEAAAQNAEAKSLLLPSAKLASVLRVCLKLNNEMAKVDGIIDFNDQPYLAVTECSHIGRKWKTVIADEMQDLNGLSLEQIKRACTSQLVLVGDRFQNIYASMRGSNYNDIIKLVESRKMRELELTITFRCPKMVAARQTISEGSGPLKRFTPTKDAKVGIVSYPFFSVENRTTSTGRVRATAVWTFGAIQAAVPSKPTSTTTVITATNADLIAAMALLCAEKGCRLRDLPKFFYRGVLYPVTAWRSAYRKNVAEPTAVDRLPSAMNLFCHITKQTPDEAAEDFAACGDLKALDKATLFAGTVHVQKGLEYDTVIVINGPSFFGQAELRYVAETRTKNALIGVDLCTHKMTVYRPKMKLAERAAYTFFGAQRAAAEGRPLIKGKEWKNTTVANPSVMKQTAIRNVPKKFFPNATLLGPVKSK
jgi:hypothetical protein